MCARFFYACAGAGDTFREVAIPSEKLFLSLWVENESHDLAQTGVFPPGEIFHFAGRKSLTSDAAFSSGI